MAIFIPMYPARAEQMAPKTKERETSQPRRGMKPKIMATTTTKRASIPYSRFKKALAPSWMAAEISRILSDPSSFFKTLRTRKNAKINPKIPEMAAINISSILLLLVVNFFTKKG
jgi:hypothetical protein